MLEVFLLKMSLSKHFCKSVFEYVKLRENISIAVLA